MASNLDKSLGDIISNYGPTKRTGGRKDRSSPYTSKPKPTQVFVGNLPWSIKWMELKDMAKKYGDCRRADIAEEGGRSKGFGIVVFSTAEEAQACIKGLHGEIVQGRDLTVKLDDKPEMFERIKQSSNNNSRQKRFTPGGSMMVGNHMLSSPMGMMGGGMMGGNTMMFGQHTLSSPMGNMMGQHQGNSYQSPRKSGNPGCQVFVGNLPWATKWQDLKDLCKQFGPVKRADVAEEGGRSKGYGIVVFGNRQSANACVASLHGHLIDGRDLTVKIDEKPDQGIAYGGGRGGGSNNNGMQFGQHRLMMGGQMGGHSFGNSKTVFVGNLPWSVKWQDLKDLCRPYGNVLRADVQENEEGKSRGFGIVQFDSPLSAQNCIANLHGQILGGRDLTVHEDKYEGKTNSRGPVRVFIGNLPWSFNRWQDLKDLCRNFGEVIRADIEEEEGGRSKGYGVVTFSNALGAQNCIQNLNGQVLNGRDLTVKLDRYAHKAEAKTTSKPKKHSNGSSKKSTNWNEEVPDQATLDAEMDDYNKSKAE